MEGTEFDGRNKSRCLRNCNKYKLTQDPDKKAARLGRKNPILLFTETHWKYKKTDMLKGKDEKKMPGKY